METTYPLGDDQHSSDRSFADSVSTIYFSGFERHNDGVAQHGCSSDIVGLEI